MFTLRIGDRKKPPQRVEGIEHTMTLDGVRQLSAWVLRGSSPPEEPGVWKLVIDGKTFDFTGDDTLGSRELCQCGVQNSSLVLVYFDDTAGSPPPRRASQPPQCPAPPGPTVESNPLSVRRTPTDADLLLLGTFNEIGVHPESGDLWFGDSEQGPSPGVPAPAAVRIVPLRQRRQDVGLRRGSQHWVLNFSGELFPADRAQWSFRVSCDAEDGDSAALLASINSRLFGFRVWSAEVAPSRSFLTIRFAMERNAATWAHRRSATLSQLPLDVLRRVMAYLSPCGELEISLIDKSTRLPLALGSFTPCLPGGSIPEGLLNPGTSSAFAGT